MNEMKELNHLPLFWGFELLERTINGITERKLVHGFAAQQCQSLPEAGGGSIVKR